MPKKAYILGNKMEEGETKLLLFKSQNALKFLNSLLEKIEKAKSYGKEIKEAENEIDKSTFNFSIDSINQISKEFPKKLDPLIKKIIFSIYFNFLRFYSKKEDFNTFLDYLVKISGKNKEIILKINTSSSDILAEDFNLFLDYLVQLSEKNKEIILKINISSSDILNKKISKKLENLFLDFRKLNIEFRLDINKRDILKKTSLDKLTGYFAGNPNTYTYMRKILLGIPVSEIDELIIEIKKDISLLEKMKTPENPIISKAKEETSAKTRKTLD